MTINEAAIRLFAYFSPEERSIPDSVTYPGRNAAVIGALNGALQLLFAKSGPWVRKDERGALLIAPTAITLSATNGSADATVTSGWQDWMEGCSIIIDGHTAENQIRAIDDVGRAAITINPSGTNNTMSFTAKANGSGGNDISIEITGGEYAPDLEIQVTDSAIIAVPVKGIRVTGSLTSNGTAVVTFPLLLPVSSAFFSSDGNETPPASGTWYRYMQAIGNWVLSVFVNGAETVFWEGTIEDPTPTDPIVGASTLAPTTPATGTPTLAAEIATTAAQVVAAINASAEASALVTAANVGASTGIVATVAETHLTGGSNAIVLKIPFGGTTGSKAATVYQDSITIGDDVLEVNDPVMANGIELRGMVRGGGPSQRSEVNDYGAAGFMSNPSQSPVSHTGQPLFYSVNTWTKDATTPDRLRMSISPAPDVAGTLTYDALLLPPEVTDLASTNALPIPFGMADSVFIPIAVMKLYGTSFFRDQTNQTVVDQYKLAMEQIGKIDPQKKPPTFVTLG